MDYQIILDYTIGYSNCSKAFVRDQLAKHKGKPVNVLISSYGGLLDDGLDIMQQFLDHGNVTAYISGFTASAATVCAMGAKKIVMGKYAFFLVHKCANYIDAWGSYNADQLQQLINELIANKEDNEKIDFVLAQLYADRCKKSVEEMKDILTEGRWLNAIEAKEIGFVDEIESFDEKVNLTGIERRRIINLGFPIDGLPGEEQPTWLAGLVEKIKNLAGAEKKTENDNGDNLNHTPMRKNLTLICAALAVEFLTANEDGTVSLTDEQLKSLEKHIADLNTAADKKDNDIAERDNRIAELEKQVENLQQQPGDNTKEGVQVPEDEILATATKSKDMYNQIKDIL